ncbi:leucine Rich Repeat [Seminavis robusta]|uniref:Leucine Rich Repeat n=1 Tax=Seminavis robusta TaxID=568900 RepID=A0A9N8E0B2_9STRA|nr:leucine Rich Repeat [Seminavis robusta]|eukprot:Sro519_g158940.1 leucine Rich Repeat (640) ;mRNA; f:9972-12067
MEPSVGGGQMDDEEELMDIVAARSRGGSGEVGLRELEMFELEIMQQREYEQSKQEEIHPSTPGNTFVGDEVTEELKEDDVSTSKVVQDQMFITNHPQVTSKTPSAEAGPEEVQPRLTCVQNQPVMATAHPGAYAVAPGNTSNESTADDQATTPREGMDGLVVANPVEENEEPTQIARPGHLHGNTGSTSMTLMILVLIGSLLFVGAIVGSICGAGLCSNQEGDVETQAPTSIRYSVLEDIKNRIEEAFGPDYFPENDEPEPTQPKFKALDWIVFDDPLQLNPHASNLLQRFILSLTYFQTSRESDWLDCGPSTTANDETCWIRMRGFESVASRWLTGVHECQWAGIYCDGEKDIAQLQLYQNGLNGPLPTELASLTALESMHLKGNQLTGSIPLELFGTKLSSLSLANNSLTGTVPTEVGLFDGTVLQFGSNSLSGSIPTELFQTGKRITTFRFNDNMLTGTLPTEIAALHGLNQLIVYLQGNPLRGTIRSEIGLLQGSLKELDISWTHMDGSLPEELFTKCTNLISLRVSNCGLTGTISTGLQLLTNIQTFDVSNNKFHGTIPKQLSDLTELRQFIVNGNGLSGSMPSAVCALADPGKEYFEVTADCLPSEGTGNPMVECSCCTLCCDGDAEDYCLPV